MSSGFQGIKQGLQEAITHAGATELQTPADVAARLTLALESDGPAFMVAFRAIVWAWGLDDIATVCGMSGDELAKELHADARQRFDTVRRVCHALGVRLVAQPVHA